jgi:hypothetical protein
MGGAWKGLGLAEGGLRGEGALERLRRVLMERDSRGAAHG